MNPKHDLKRAIKGIKEHVEIIGFGFDLDLFYLISDLFDYAEYLEERIDKLEERTRYNG